MAETMKQDRYELCSNGKTNCYSCCGIPFNMTAEEAHLMFARKAELFRRSNSIQEYADMMIPKEHKSCIYLAHINNDGLVGCLIHPSDKDRINTPSDKRKAYGQSHCTNHVCPTLEMYNSMTEDEREDLKTELKDLRGQELTMKIRSLNSKLREKKAV